MDFRTSLFKGRRWWKVPEQLTLAKVQSADILPQRQHEVKTSSHSQRSNPENGIQPRMKNDKKWDKPQGATRGKGRSQSFLQKFPRAQPSQPAGMQCPTIFGKWRADNPSCSLFFLHCAQLVTWKPIPSASPPLQRPSQWEQCIINNCNVLPWVNIC